MNKSQQFIKALRDILAATTRDEIKFSIGDSTDNNRTLSVNQLIRYLRGLAMPSHKLLASDLELVYSSLRPVITGARAASRRRTDAIDINEFATAFGAAYFVSPGFRRSLGHRLSSF